MFHFIEGIFILLDLIFHQAKSSNATGRLSYISLLLWKIIQQTVIHRGNQRVCSYKGVEKILEKCQVANKKHSINLDFVMCIAFMTSLELFLNIFFLT